MARLVLKFGGTSVKDPLQIKKIAEIIAQEATRGHELVVVVSAMAGMTNKLAGYCEEVGNALDAREMDVVLSSGEQITAGLLALALQALGLKARSMMGWQVPILTNARYLNATIHKVEIAAIQAAFAKGQIVVVPGFQGLSENNRITTLGRGGSDLTAVALAAALKAERCDIYTDVDGIYSSDPNKIKAARKIKQISYDEMLAMARHGAKVMQRASAEMAKKWGVKVQVLSSFTAGVGSDLKGTLIVPPTQLNEVKGKIVGFAERPNILLGRLWIAVSDFDVFYKKFIAFFRNENIKCEALYFQRGNGKEGADKEKADKEKADKEEKEYLLGWFLTDIFNRKQMDYFLRNAEVESYSLETDYCLIAPVSNSILEHEALLDALDCFYDALPFATPFYLMGGNKIGILIPKKEKNKQLEQLHHLL